MLLDGPVVKLIGKMRDAARFDVRLIGVLREDITVESIKCSFSARSANP